MGFSVKELSARNSAAQQYVQNLSMKTGEDFVEAAKYCTKLVRLHSILIELMNGINNEYCGEIKIYSGAIKLTSDNDPDTKYTLEAANDKMFEYFTKKETKTRLVEKTSNGKTRKVKEKYVKDRIITISKAPIKRQLINLSRFLKLALESEYMRGYIPESVHSYRNKHSYATCAKVHAGKHKKYIMTYDVTNYFHCITKRMIHVMTERMLDELFSKDKMKKYKASSISLIVEDMKVLIPNIMASLCTVTAPDKSTTKPVLAMGLEPSGILANLALIEADRHFEDVFGALGMIYTRYSDNIIISSRRKVTDDEKKIVPEYISEASFCTEKKPFRLNEDKTSLKIPRYRQRILGIIVNEKTNVPSETEKWLRSRLTHLYYDCKALSDGVAAGTITGKSRWSQYRKLRRSLRKTQGNISYMKAINETKYEKYNTWLYTSAMLLKSIGTTA